LNDFERRNGSYFFVILPNLVVSEAHCTNVVDKAITMDNLRLLCLLVNVCKGIARRPLYKFKTLCAARTTCLYELSIGTEIGDLEWPWTAKWSLFCVILPNLVASGAHCVKVIGKAITMDNLRLLCLVVNVCRDAMCLCFSHDISKPNISKKMQLQTPNLTQKCSTKIPGNSCVLGSKGQRSRSQVTKTLPAWVFALLWVLAASSITFG